MLRASALAARFFWQRSAPMPLGSRALGPLNLATVAQLLAPETAHGRASAGGAAECEPQPIAMCALGAAVVSLVLKCGGTRPTEQAAQCGPARPLRRGLPRGRAGAAQRERGWRQFTHLPFFSQRGGHLRGVALAACAAARLTDAASGRWRLERVALFLGRSIFVLSLPNRDLPPATLLQRSPSSSSRRCASRGSSRTLLLLSVITLALDIAFPDRCRRLLRCCSSRRNSGPGRTKWSPLSACK